MRGRAASKAGITGALVAFTFGVVACGAFSAAEGPPSGAADAAVDGAVTSAPDAGAGCTILFSEPFTSLDAFQVSAENSAGSQVGLSDQHRKSDPTALLVEGKGKVSVFRTLVPPRGEAARNLVVDYDVWVGRTGTYLELGCTVELRNEQGDSTRLLFAKRSDDALAVRWDTNFNSEEKVVIVSPTNIQEGWQHVRLVVDPTDQAKAGVTFSVTPGGSLASPPFTVTLPPGTDRVGFVCGIDYAETSSVDLITWVDDLVVQTCPAP